MYPALVFTGVSVIILVSVNAVDIIVSQLQHFMASSLRRTLLLFSFGRRAISFESFARGSQLKAHSYSSVQVSDTTMLKFIQLLVTKKY
jgi:hypothetical protein